MTARPRGPTGRSRTSGQAVGGGRAPLRSCLLAAARARLGVAAVVEGVEAALVAPGERALLGLLGGRLEVHRQAGVLGRADDVEAGDVPPLVGRDVLDVVGREIAVRPDRPAVERVEGRREA